MKRIIFPVLITLMVAWLAPVDAQLFSRKPKGPPAQRVGELIGQVKTDAEEGKRAAAAEELREFDVKKFPEIVPILVDVARSDKKASVRHEALDSLAKIRPVSQPAGQMLEWAAQHDESWKNRWLAKTSLARYQWLGYQAQKKDGKAPTTPATQEPPLLDSQRPPTKPAVPTRTTSTKTTPQLKNLPKVVSQPAPPPQIVTQPPPQIVATPTQRIIEPPLPSGLTPTPPPLIIEAPAPKTPSVPAVSTATDLVVSPNFRPAGVSPPRVAPSTPPPVKTDDRGPALTRPK